MNCISLKRLLYYCHIKWKVIVVSTVLLTIIFLGLGVKTAIEDRQSIDESLEQYNVVVTEYQNTVQKYDDGLLELQEAAEIAKEQIEKLEEYCDNSIYMNLDSQSIAIADIQYVVRKTEIPGNILNSFVAYINDGSLTQEISTAIDGISVEYLNEIISCGINGNTLNVSVMHFDETQAELIMSVLEDYLIQKSENITSVFGDFVFERTNKSLSFKSDAAVLNAQNTQLSNLKNYKSNYLDLTKKIIVQEQDRQTYIEENNPEEFSQTSFAKLILTYGIIGIIIGVFLPVFFFLLRVVIDDRVMSREELKFIGVPVFDCILGDHTKNDVQNSFEKLSLLAQKNQIKELFISIPTGDAEIDFVEKYSKEVLNKQGLSVIVGRSALNDLDEIKKMIAVDNCILVVQLGRTTCTQLEDQLDVCRKFKISVFESIVVN